MAYLASLPTVYAVDQYQLRVAPKIAAERRGRAVDLEIAEIIRDRTPADGWVLADNPLAAYIARRKVLPYLVDTSGTRIDAGSLTAALAIDQIQRYQPSVIVTWPRRLRQARQADTAPARLGYRLERSYERVEGVRAGVGTQPLGPWTEVHVYSWRSLRDRVRGVQPENPPAWRSHAPMVDVDFSPRTLGQV